MAATANTETEINVLGQIGSGGRVPSSRRDISNVVIVHEMGHLHRCFQFDEYVEVPPHPDSADSLLRSHHTS